jgi:hypothetical protein
MLKLVFDLSDDLLEQILERHQADGGPTLVDDQRKVPCV